MKVIVKHINPITGESVAGGEIRTIGAADLKVVTHCEPPIDIVHLSMEECDESGTWMQADLTSEEAVQLANVLMRAAYEKRREMTDYYKDIED